MSTQCETSLSFEISEISAAEEMSSSYHEVTDDEIMVSSPQATSLLTSSIESDITNTGDTLQSVNTGFKIVFDNLDETVKPRHMSKLCRCIMCMLML